MKDMETQKTKRLSEYIATLEQEIELGHNVQENMKSIEDLTQKLSVEEMLQIDDYILSHKILKNKGE